MESENRAVFEIDSLFYDKDKIRKKKQWKR